LKNRLEKIQTKSAYEAALALIEIEIETLNKRKANFNINEHFKADLEELNQLKYQINLQSSEISKLNIRQELIHETERDLSSSTSDIEYNLKSYNEDLKLIDDELFSDDFEATVKLQLNKFNRHFASTSDVLYGEQYALKYDKIINRKGQRLYKFSAFNLNFSSGKKQGEIYCFDIAYTFFADEENIPCMHFLLNDKKELMHDNQLVKIADLVNRNNIQFVASILKDKLPERLNKEEYFILKLSENDKLFKIEKE